MKTWRVPETFTATGEELLFLCDCGQEAAVPTNGGPGAIILATFGRRVVFDPPWHTPPPGWLPPSIQCRKCGRIYESQEQEEKPKSRVVSEPGGFAVVSHAEYGGASHVR